MKLVTTVGGMLVCAVLPPAKLTLVVAAAALIAVPPRLAPEPTVPDVPCTLVSTVIETATPWLCDGI